MRRLVPTLVLLAGLVLGANARAEPIAAPEPQRALLQPTADWWAGPRRVTGWEALLDPFELLEPTLDWYALLEPTGHWYHGAITQAVTPRHARRAQVTVDASQITVRSTR
jgi:hypothetical protein